MSNKERDQQSSEIEGTVRRQGFVLGWDAAVAHETERTKDLLNLAEELSEYHFMGEGACLFCDMGDAGDPVDDKGHDMDCAVGKAMRCLNKFKAGQDE